MDRFVQPDIETTRQKASGRSYMSILEKRIRFIGVLTLVLSLFLSVSVPVAADAYNVKIVTNPANTGYITFESTQTYDEEIENISAGDYSIDANAGTGYGFYKWQVEGDISVDDPTSADTTCHVAGDGTLRMVQLPIPEALWSYSETGDITDIAVGELTGDDKKDIAAIDSPPVPDTLSIIQGDGNLYWDKPLNGYAVEVGDIDGNEIDEVVCAKFIPGDPYNGIYAYRNNATGATAPMWFYPTESMISDIALGDIDGNKVADVVACSIDGAIYVIDGDGEDLPNWPIASENTGFEHFIDLAVGPLDNADGMDVAAIGIGPENTLYVFNSQGEEFWSLPKDINGRTVEIGNVDGDLNGTNEVVAGTYNGLVMVFSGGAGTELYSFTTEIPVMDVELGDLDGNEENGLEVACITGDVGGHTLYALDIDNIADQIMWTYPISWDSQITPQLEYMGESIAIGDVDHDYMNEVVACSNNNNTHGVYAFDGLDKNNDELGDLVWSPCMVEGNSEPKITDLEIGDFDGDGDKDAAFGTTVFWSKTNELSSIISAVTAADSETMTYTNSGIACFDSDPSTLVGLEPVDEQTLPPDGKPNFSYPHGFFSFRITGLDPGQKATVTITLPDAVPLGTKWVKCHDNTYYVMDIGSSDDEDNIITIDLTDGVEGEDDDGEINGTILDDGGPGIPIASAGDFVWEDSNMNGIQDAGEPGIDGVTVDLYTGAGNPVEQDITAGGGFYSFSSLVPGDYYIVFTCPSGYVFTSLDQGGNDAIDSDANPTTGRTATTTLIGSEDDLTWDAGIYKPLDFGDAPAPYPAAQHVLHPNFHLGNSIDAELTAMTDATATGDDLNGTDDEDGVIFDTPLTAGLTANITVTASLDYQQAYFNGWLDFNADGDWDDAGERIFNNIQLIAGANALSFNVPINAERGETFARFRLSAGSPIDSYAGFGAELSQSGEIEDYQVTILKPNVVDPKTVRLAIDADYDGVPSPGDILRYTCVINNTGDGKASDVLFSDIPDANTLLIAGSVNTTPPVSALAITEGNTFGDTRVAINLGTILAGDSATVRFDVLIKADCFEKQVANQAMVTGANFLAVNSDDPGTAQVMGDPTVLAIQQAQPQGIGGEVATASRLRVIFPWLATAIAGIITAAALGLSRRRTN
jgi:uncharacterized repeat protein (TIGR01451 family)